MGFTSFLQQAISTLRERLLPLRGPFPIDQSPARDRVSPITNVSIRNSGVQKKTFSNDQPVVCVQHIESNIVPDASSLEELSGREVDEIVRAPLDYLLTQPGKRLRTKLIQAFNEWYHIPDDKLQVVIDVVELLHTASLLVDDIQDGSKLRRGRPSAHMVYGLAQTINSANFAYFLAQERVSELKSMEALNTFTTELLNLHRGQGMELYFRDNLICPTEEQYMEIVSNKTGGLFRLAASLIKSQSDISIDCTHLMDKLGMIYQVRDDYQNLWSEVQIKHKGFGDDLTEGKFSFPIIHSMSAAPDNSYLIDVLRQRTEDETIKMAAVRYMESTGSFGYCTERLDTLQVQALELVTEIEGVAGPCRLIRRILDMLIVSS